MGGEDMVVNIEEKEATCVTVCVVEGVCIIGGVRQVRFRNLRHSQCVLNSSTSLQPYFDT